MATAKLVTPESREFGRRVKALAAKRGLGDEAVAKAFGVTPSAIIAIYKGQNAQQYMKLAEMARTFGVTPNDLLGFTEPDRGATVLPAQAITTLTDLIAGILIGCAGWDEDTALPAAEEALRFAQELPPKVGDPRQWTRAIAADRVRRLREPPGRR